MHIAFDSPEPADGMWFCIAALLVGDCVVDGLSTPESLERSLAPFLPACRCTGSRGQCSSPRTSQASRTGRTVTILHFGCVSGASFTESHEKIDLSTRFELLPPRVLLQYSLDLTAMLSILQLCIHKLSACPECAW